MKFSSDFFNFEFLRVLGTAPFHGADIAECLEAASQIQSNDPNSWYGAWSRAAENAEAIGDDARRTGDRQAALWAYLRASNYRRSSEFMLHHLPLSDADGRSRSSLEQGIQDFRGACKLMDSPVKFIDIPYQHAGITYHLPGYLFLPLLFSVAHMWWGRRAKALLDSIRRGGSGPDYSVGVLAAWLQLNVRRGLLADLPAWLSFLFGAICR